MSDITKNQSGFAALETILLFIILVLVVGTGVFVYHSNKKTSDTLSNASQDARSSPGQIAKKTSKIPAASTTSTPKATTPTTGYIAIPDWNVRAPITDGLTYIRHDKQTSDSGLFIGFTSTKLAAFKGCEESGGSIGRYTANEPADDASDTAAEMAKSVPNIVKQVGSYYFVYTHDQAACSEDSSADSAQMQNNTDLLKMMQNFQSY